VAAVDALRACLIIQDQAFEVAASAASQRLKPLLRANLQTGPNYDAACFHSQQCAEKYLKDYAVDIRYPGETATKDEARAAVKAMQAVRAFVRPKLGLGDQSG